MSAEIEQAHDAIDQADRIYFIGFGYNETNIKRLNIPWGHGNKMIVGSCYDFRVAECDAIVSRCQDLRLSNPKFDALEFLRNASSQL